MARWFEPDILSPSIFELDRPKLRYRKTTGGILPLFGRLIKKGQIVHAYPEEMKAYMKQFMLIDAPEVVEDVTKSTPTIVVQKPESTQAEVVQAEVVQEEVPKPVRKTRKSLYEVQPVEGEDALFNVVNRITKKPINELGLTSSDALALRDTLNV